MLRVCHASNRQLGSSGRRQMGNKRDKAFTVNRKGCKYYEDVTCMAVDGKWEIRIRCEQQRSVSTWAVSWFHWTCHEEFISAFFTLSPRFFLLDHIQQTRYIEPLFFFSLSSWSRQQYFKTSSVMSFVLSLFPPLVFPSPDRWESGEQQEVIVVGPIDSIHFGQQLEVQSRLWHSDIEVITAGTEFWVRLQQFVPNSVFE